MLPCYDSGCSFHRSVKSSITRKMGSDRLRYDDHSSIHHARKDRRANLQAIGNHQEWNVKGTVSLVLFVVFLLSFISLDFASSSLVLPFLHPFTPPYPPFELFLLYLLLSLHFFVKLTACSICLSTSTLLHSTFPPILLVICLPLISILISLTIMHFLIPYLSSLLVLPIPISVSSFSLIHSLLISFRSLLPFPH